MTIDEWIKDFKSYINELQMPRDDYKGIMAYIDEGAELLKEQEAVKPILFKLYPHDVYKCGNCGHCAVGTTVPKTYRPKYCPECGRKIKWDD